MENLNSVRGCVKKELFHGRWVSGSPVSPIDGYQYKPDELTVFTITLDKEKGGLDFFTLAERG